MHQRGHSNYAKWMTHEGSCSGVSGILDNDSRLKSDPVTVPFTLHPYNVYSSSTMHATFALVMRCKRRFLGGKFPRRSALHARFLEMTRAKDE